ncbi:hypothetical protein Anapl_15865 [Anas platyrhynchos]|uniref:Uncharacterized protein n=1 Tax=Anas platyrhynchos TaxID=8839 RepID=R0JIJ8_ANAPL|nr:hypothetical protein Anapl_15865 [Anas platyrhynchos]
MQQDTVTVDMLCPQLLHQKLTCMATHATSCCFWFAATPAIVSESYIQYKCARNIRDNTIYKKIEPADTPSPEDGSRICRTEKVRNPAELPRYSTGVKCIRSAARQVILEDFTGTQDVLCEARHIKTRSCLQGEWFIQTYSQTHSSDHKYEAGGQGLAVPEEGTGLGAPSSTPVPMGGCQRA